METVSMALYLSNDKYFMQIIDAYENVFFIPITQGAASVINACNGCGVYEDIDVTHDMVTA